MTISINENVLYTMLEDAARRGAEMVIKTMNLQQPARSDVYARTVKLLKTWSQFDTDSAEYHRIADAVANIEKDGRYAGLLIAIYGPSGSFKKAAIQFGVSDSMIRKVHRRQIDQLAPVLMPNIVYNEIAREN